MCECPFARISLGRKLALARTIRTYNITKLLRQFGTSNRFQKPTTRFNGLCGQRDILRVYHAKAQGSHEVDPASFIGEHPLAIDSDASMSMYGPLRMYAIDPRCNLKLDIDALRSVLKVPTPARVGGIVAANEGDQFVVR